MEAETLGDTLSDTQALVDTLGDSAAEVEAERLGDTLRDGQALFETLVDTVADVAASHKVTHGAISRHWSTR